MLVRFVLNIIQISDPILVMHLLRCQPFLLRLKLLQSLSDVVIARRRLFLLFFTLHYLVNIGFLIGIVDLQFALFRPLHLERVFTGPRDYLVQVGLVIEIISTFCYVFSVLFTFLYFELLSLLDCFYGVEVFFLEVVALNSALALVSCHGVELVYCKHKWGCFSNKLYKFNSNLISLYEFGDKLIILVKKKCSSLINLLLN